MNPNQYKGRKMLTENDKKNIRETFALVQPIASTAAELFYNRLFDIAPQVKPLFKNSDMEQQGRHLMQTIGILVSSIDRLDTFKPHLQKLGQNHIKYGAEPGHYAVVGEALLWTLQQGLGEAFTEEVAEAWTKLYTFVAESAIEAYEPQLN